MQYFVHDDTQSSCDVVYKRAYENVAPHLRHGRGRQLNCTPPACSPPHLPRGEDSDDSWCADDG